jgi:predicted XRE-type DNA-binding protein
MFNHRGLNDETERLFKNIWCSQQEFAVLVGETQGYVSRVASGKCLLGAATALKWALQLAIK